MTVFLSCRASALPLGNRAAHDMSLGILQIQVLLVDLRQARLDIEGFKMNGTLEQ